jgi:hypothetical protein
MRDLLDAGHMLQLQERLLAIKQVDTRVQLDTLVGIQMRVGGCQRAVCEAYDAGEGSGSWVGKEGLEDRVTCYAGGAEDERSKGRGSCRHLEP